MTKYAKEDFRDILSWAEYPRQSKKWSLPDGPKKQKIVDADRVEFVEKVISSKLTFFYKYLFPVIWVGSSSHVSSGYGSKVDVSFGMDYRFLFYLYDLWSLKGSDHYRK